MKFRTLRSTATKAKARVSSLPQVVGIGWGTKVSKKRNTGERCITVFVRRKIAKAKLTSAQRIPTTITFRGKVIRTDVVSLGELRLESAQHLRSGDRRGTSGIYASRGSELFAVSCAHVMEGDDAVFTPDDVVEYYQTNWQPLGPTAAVQEDNGFGTISDWGMFDAAIARVDDPSFSALVEPLIQAWPFDHVESADQLVELCNQPVFALRANGNRLDAEVVAVLTDDTSLEFAKHDLLIRHPEGRGLTRLGDSGIVWRLANGQPLGIHFGGYRQNSADVSTVSACFFAQRVINRFSVSLLEGRS